MRTTETDFCKEFCKGPQTYLEQWFQITIALLTTLCYMLNSCSTANDVVIVTRSLSQDKGMLESHGDTEVDHLPTVWIRARK